MKNNNKKIFPKIGLFLENFCTIFENFRKCVLQFSIFFEIIRLETKTNL